MKRLTICVLAGSLLCAAAPLPAQEHSCLQRSFLVNAVDKEGKTLTGLTAENFKGKFRGKPVRVVSMRDRNIIPRIVVLLDTSRSMGKSSTTKWRLASLLAKHPALAFRPEAEIALIVFSDGIQVEVGFEKPRQAIEDAIAALQEQNERKRMSGRTALFAAILRATELLKPGRPGDVIYIVSDGGENAGDADYRDVERAVLKSGARVFATILVSRYGQTSVEGLLGPIKLQSIALATGGYITSILSEGKFGDPFKFTGTRGHEITLLLDQLYRRMWELTEIEIELPREADKPRTWKLELVSTHEVSVKGASLTYPEKLVPCTP